jgi:site-specific recombinase XerC
LHEAAKAYWLARTNQISIMPDATSSAPNRLAEMAGIRYDPADPGRSDLDLDRREIYIRGKGGKDRTVGIDDEAARRVDRVSAGPRAA